jgi:hypothetical protein
MSPLRVVEPVDVVVVRVAGIHDVGAAIAVHEPQRDGSAELDRGRPSLRPYAALSAAVNMVSIERIELEP